MISSPISDCWIGIPAALAAGHLMEAELFGARAWNPLVLGATTVVLGRVAPSRSRAARPTRRHRGPGESAARGVVAKTKTVAAHRDERARFLI